MTRLRLLFSLLVLCTPPLAFTQDNKEKVLCAGSKLGSAIGASECFSYRVKNAEKIWQALVEKNARVRAAKAESEEWLYEIIRAEAKSWRAHLKDKCLLDVAGTAGMVQWDYAYALHCEAEGLQARIQELRKAVDDESK